MTNHDAAPGPAKFSITDGPTTIEFDAPTSENGPYWLFISGAVDDGFGSCFPSRAEMIRLRDWLMENVHD